MQSRLSGRGTIICATVGQLSSCAPIHRRSVSALVSSKRPVETGQQDKSCPTIAQIIVPRPLNEFIKARSQMSVEGSPTGFFLDNGVVESPTIRIQIV